MEITGILNKFANLYNREVMATDSNGNKYILVADNQKTPNILYLYKKTPTATTYTRLVSITQFSPRYIKGYDIAIDSNDYIWVGITTDNHVINYINSNYFLTAYNASGQTVQAMTEVISDTEMEDPGCKMAIAPNDKIWIFYAIDGWLHQKILNNDLTSYVADNTDSTEYDTGNYIKIIFDGNGRCWSFQVSDNWGSVTAVIYNTDGTIYKTQFYIPDDTTYAWGSLDAIIDSNGKIVFASEYDDDAEENRTIRFIVFNTDGTVYKTLTEITGINAVSIYGLTLNIDSDGNIYVVTTYYQPNEGDWTDAIRRLSVAKLNSAYESVFGITEILNARNIQTIGSDLMPNNQTVQELETILAYEGYEEKGTLKLTIDTFVPTEAVFAQIGTLY